ncbi:MAG: hypothetical protein NZ866_02770 [Patescibacteria group bacterium]|nr:hypothetical protein [Patescibacteria group bacterium]
MERQKKFKEIISSVSRNILVKLIEIFYYFTRENNPEKGEEIAILINNYLNEIYYLFPEKNLSELAENLDYLFSGVIEIIENKHKSKIILPQNREEWNFIFSEIINSLHQQLFQLFTQKEIANFLIFIFLRKFEISTLEINSANIAEEVCKLYKEILTFTFLRVLEKIEQRNNLTIENKQGIIDNYFTNHPILEYDIFNFFVKIIGEKRELFTEETRSETVLLEKPGKLKELIKKEKIEESLNFYGELAENVSNECRESFIRAGNYENYQKDIEYFIEKLKKIITKIRFIPQNQIEFRSLIYYFATELYFLYIDEKIISLFFKLKSEDIEKMRDPNKSQEIIKREFEVYLLESRGITFYISTLREILTRLKFKILNFLNQKLEQENISDEERKEIENSLNDINNLDIEGYLERYTERNIGLKNFSYQQNISYHYYIYFTQRIVEENF